MAFLRVFVINWRITKPVDTTMTPLFSWLKGVPPGINPSSCQQKKSHFDSKWCALLLQAPGIQWCFSVKIPSLLGVSKYLTFSHKVEVVFADLSDTSCSSQKNQWSFSEWCSPFFFAAADQARCGTTIANSRPPLLIDCSALILCLHTLEQQLGGCLTMISNASYGQHQVVLYSYQTWLRIDVASSTSESLPAKARRSASDPEWFSYLLLLAERHGRFNLIHCYRVGTPERSFLIFSQRSLDPLLSGFPSLSSSFLMVSCFRSIACSSVFLVLLAILLKQHLFVLLLFHQALGSSCLRSPTNRHVVVCDLCHGYLNTQWLSCDASVRPHSSTDFKWFSVLTHLDPGAN